MGERWGTWKQPGKVQEGVPLTLTLLPAHRPCVGPGEVPPPMLAMHYSWQVQGTRVPEAGAGYVSKGAGGPGRGSL